MTDYWRTPERTWTAEQVEAEHANFCIEQGEPECSCLAPCCTNQQKLGDELAMCICPNGCDCGAHDV